jgi:hypothetical protein
VNRTFWLGILALLVVTFAISVAWGNRLKTNPPVVAEPAWNSPETRALAVRACFACHSNETRWPWYSNVPVVRGLIVKHVREGRQKLNFSAWQAGRELEANEVPDKVYDPTHYLEEDIIPQPSFQALHPEARLTRAEQDQLAQGFRASLGGSAQSGTNNSAEEKERVD